MKLWVPEGVEDKYLEGFPSEVDVGFFPKEGAFPPEIDEVEFLVPPFAQKDDVQKALQRMGNLKVIQTLSAGIDWILPIVPEGVTLCNARGVHNIPVAEWTVAAILSVLKRFPDFRDSQKEGVWRDVCTPPVPDDLSGKRVLILGYGSVGRAVEDRLEPFGVEILRIAKHQRHQRPRDEIYSTADLFSLLPEVDIVVVLLPYTTETAGLVNSKFLSHMKDGALLVNASRGKVIDIEALIEALRDHRIYAALDIIDPEPLPEDNPLWGMPNVFITPHIAWSSPKFLERAYAMVQGQVRRYLNHEPLLNVILGDY